MQCFPDEFIGHVGGAVVLGGVDVVDAQGDGAIKDGERLITIPGGRPEDTGSGQLHCSEPDAGDVERTERMGLHTPRLCRPPPGGSLFAEDLVDLAAGVVDDLEDALLLLIAGGVHRLGDGTEQLSECGAQVDGVGIGIFGDGVPRRGLDLLGRGAASSVSSKVFLLPSLSVGGTIRPSSTSS